MKPQKVKKEDKLSVFSFKHDQNKVNKLNQSLQENCSYSKFLWSIFFCIRTEYEEIQSISPYSVQIRKNKDQKNFEYGYFSRSECQKEK